METEDLSAVYRALLRPALRIGVRLGDQDPDFAALAQGLERLQEILSEIEACQRKPNADA